jgi:putative chitinase
MPAITVERLKRFAPHIHANFVEAFMVPNADQILIDAGITSALILCHFMGQTFEETGGYITMTENLNYSAERLHDVFPRRFRSAYAAEDIAGDPMRVAEAIYGGRMGNRNPGDGWKYRGGGMLQLTGSDNYKLMAKKCGIDIWKHPDLVRDPQSGLNVAAQCFKALGAVAAAANDDGRLVTLRVNGGYINEAARQEATDRASEIFDEDPVSHQLRSAPSPYGLVGDFDNPPDAPAPAAMVGFASLGETSQKSPMTMTQAKALQSKLKEKNYNPGDVNGNIHNPSTVGAIATLQKQQDLPVTGIVDDATEDAIQDAPSKVVSEDRANETPATLRAKGSEVIAATDGINLATHGVSVGGVGILGAGATGAFEAINSQADQVKSITDHVPGLSEKLALFISGNLGVVALIAAGAALLFIAMKLYKNKNTVLSERVRKSRTGEDMSH